MNGVLNASCPASCSAVQCWKWDVTQLISAQTKIKFKYAVLILNRPLTQDSEFLCKFWNNASVRMTVDGGTSRWDQYISTLPNDVQDTIKLPDLVTGDFDSISPEILEKYTKKGCKIQRTPNQDYTDFTKALMALKEYCQQNNTELDHIIALAQCSGRIDQTLANIQTLYIAKQTALFDPTKLYLVADDSLSWLLCPGDHVIKVPLESRVHSKAWCSLVPVGETCRTVTSSGLKWNLVNQPLKFGELVSTSNTFDGSEQVKIKCSNTILWSMKIPSLTGIL